MKSLRWILGPEKDGSERLFRALATLGFKAPPSWRYPSYPAPFDVSFTNGRVEVSAKFETSEGVVVSGAAATIQELQEIYDRLPNTR